MNLQTCMFTNTEDNHFVIDLHPEYPQVALASPCSGHGFKFASVVGEIMADLAEKGMTRHDISLFRLDRLLRHRAPLASQSQPAELPEQMLPEHNGRQYSFPRVEDVKPFW
jgi:sarcosine oxidase